MAIPHRLQRQTGRHARVDGIPFELPVNSEQSPALMAAFPIDAGAARRLLPGNELHPFRIWGNRGLLIVTVIDYRVTDIGPYIEFSIGLACTHGARPGLPLLPALLRKPYGLGQFVYDLPVSTEVSVKGGKGIWGMPKHQAPLDFVIGEETVSSQYDLDGHLAMRIDIDRPGRAWLPVHLGLVNYCRFRGMLMKSYIYFKSQMGVSLFPKGAAAHLTLGDHPRMKPLKTLDISPRPVLTAFMPETSGVLDDHFECWFLSEETTPPAAEAGDGLESVVDLGQDETWPPPPDRSPARTTAPDERPPPSS